MSNGYRTTRTNCVPCSEFEVSDLSAVLVYFGTGDTKQSICLVCCWPPHCLTLIGKYKCGRQEEKKKKKGNIIVLLFCLQIMRWWADDSLRANWKRLFWKTTLSPHSYPVLMKIAKLNWRRLICFQRCRGVCCHFIWPKKKGKIKI